MPQMAPLLEYGLTGLAAILAFLSYRLLVKESDMKSPRKAMLTAIKSFAILAIVLALISATSSAIESFVGSAQQKDVTALQEELTKAKGEITRLEQSGTSQEAIDALETQLATAKEEITRLAESSTHEAELADLQSRLEEAERIIEDSRRAAEVESEIATKFIADLLLSDVSLERSVRKQAAATAEPTSTVADQSEARFRLLKRAVFNHVARFNGDADVLSRALTHLSNRGRTEVEGHEQRIIEELPQIMQLRLRWLEDQAIPALRADIEFLESRPMVQRDPIALAPIPEELWLFQHPEGDEPTEVVGDMADLEAEVRFLKSIL